MRAVIQRVKHASVSINGKLKSEIEKGFLVLLGVKDEDTQEQADWIIKRTAGLRVFDDENDHMNLSLADVGGEILLISQFTLFGDCSRGFRPSFIEAARPEKAVPLYEYVCAGLGEAIGEEHIKTGEFGADMQVELLNDGPVTIILDTDNIKPRK